ncbi:hypothetical protein S7335_3641 [Synechococcus sp. PCC 7335]|nr:hypothetical protein S7335_3641 [Synechococcus sp. PCC 7335]
MLISLERAFASQTEGRRFERYQPSMFAQTRLAAGESELLSWKVFKVGNLLPVYIRRSYR